MAEAQLTVRADTWGIEALLQEASDLATERRVPEDLIQDIEDIVHVGDIATLGDPRVVDGKLLMVVTPTPRFLNVLERLRECPPSLREAAYRVL